MGLFDFLFESEESKAAKLRQQELARQEKETHVRVDWFKQQARIEKVSIAKDTCIEMCYVPPGQFKMGGSMDVELSAGFWLGRVPITQAVWEAVTGQNPSHFEGNPDLPVERVSWDHCASFIGLLEKNVTLDGRKYRFDFPTEAQWEYACSAGTLGEYAVDKFWCNQQHSMPVGQLPGNALGLQDMHGNVFEWCLDCYQHRLPGGIDPCVLPPPPPTPPAIRPRDWTPPPPPSVSRVCRGGCWISDAANCFSSGRYFISPDDRNYGIGFRLALVPSR